MWHPLLKKKKIKNSNFIIVDKRKKFDGNFPIFLEIKTQLFEKKNNSSAQDLIFNPTNDKMNCICKFSKNVLQKSIKGNSFKHKKNN